MYELPEIRSEASTPAGPSELNRMQASLVILSAVPCQTLYGSSRAGAIAAAMKEPLPPSANRQANLSGMQRARPSVP